MYNQKIFGAGCAAVALSLLVAACGSGGSGRIGGTTGGTTGGSTGGSTGGTTGTTTGSSTGGTATPNLAMGMLTGTSFTAGTIFVGQASLAAGGSSGLRVDIVDTNAGNTLYTTAPVIVTFNSPCISQGLASVTGPVTTNTGSAQATYVAKGCNGSDVVTATASANSQNLSASGTITVQPATIGSLRFVSASPSMIGIRGAGQTEASTVTFQLLDTTGSPVQNAVVNFSLDTTVGGITLSSPTGRTDSQGNAQVSVTSGTVATTVRVTASAVTASGNTISSQSSGLVISTGIPDQDSFSLSFEKVNLEGDTYDGNTMKVTARLADRFNNPVFDGTPVSFTAEGGSIQSSCQTVGGACSVTFTTQNPRTRNLAAANTGTSVYTVDNCGTYPNAPSNATGCDDHRYTILARAIGEESFTDTNGNGFYDSGEPFVDLGEPFLDVNENGTFESSIETFADFNSDNVRNGASGNFTGVLCNSGCDSAHSLYVYASQTVVMSSSTAVVQVNPNPISVGVGQSVLITVRFSDTAGQRMAGGTAASGTATIGTLTAVTPLTIADSTALGPSVVQFSLAAPTTPGTGTFSANVTSTTGVVSNVTVPITVN